MHRLKRFTLMVFIALISTQVRAGSSVEKASAKEKDQFNQDVSKEQLDDGIGKLKRPDDQNTKKSQPFERTVNSSHSEKLASPVKEGILKSKSEEIRKKLGAVLLQKVAQEALEAENKKKLQAFMKNDAKCEPKVLKAFGVHSPSYDQPQIASPDETAYCRRNPVTCCSAADFNDVIDNFTENAKKLLRSFQPIEEILTLFKGKNYQGHFNILAGNDNCQHIVASIIDPEGKNRYYFYENYTERQVAEISSLLNDIEMFLKGQLWLYGNIMCSICNPNENRYYDFKPEGSTITSSFNTCTDILEGVEFQLRLANLYNNFFEYILKLIKCHENPHSTDADKPIIPKIDPQSLQTLQLNFDTCQKSSSQDDPSCAALCSKNPSRFAPAIEFFTPYRAALSMIFSKFIKNGDVDAKIDDYYTHTYRKNFPNTDPNDITFFSVKTAEWNEYKLDKVTWKFEKEGVNIFKNQISKKFLRVNTAAVY